MPGTRETDKTNPVFGTRESEGAFADFGTRVSDNPMIEVEQEDSDEYNRSDRYEKIQQELTAIRSKHGRNIPRDQRVNRLSIVPGR